MTNYLILKANEDEHSWDIKVVKIQASSARRALTAAEVGEGTYVAIPERSWKPLIVKTEQVTKVTIG